MKDISSRLINKLLPDEKQLIKNQLAKLFNTLTNLILDKIAYLMNEKNKECKIHYLLREEQILELAKLQFTINHIIIEKEIPNINFETSSINKETDKILINNEKIDDTAKAFFQAMFNNLYKKRWIPKSKKLLENKPKKIKNRTINKVNDNHYITKSFIKKYWSDDNHQIKIYSKNNLENEPIKDSFGKFGHMKNIYSDKLEDYFGWVEGDIFSHPFNKENIIEKLINLTPLNRLEKESLIGFIMVHYLRNPFYFKKTFENLISINKIDDGEISKESIYESIFTNNDFYGEMTKNILDNQWFLIKSDNKVFILPDTALFYKKEKNSQFIIFPISPKYCLVITPNKDIRNNFEKMIPEIINLDLSNSLKISQFLIKCANENFISNDNIYTNSKEINKFNFEYEDIVKLITKNRRDYK